MTLDRGVLHACLWSTAVDYKKYQIAREMSSSDTGSGTAENDSNEAKFLDVSDIPEYILHKLAELSPQEQRALYVDLFKLLDVNEVLFKNRPSTK